MELRRLKKKKKQIEILHSSAIQANDGGWGGIGIAPREVINTK